MNTPRLLGAIEPLPSTTGVTVTDHGDRLELIVSADLDGVASGSFARPALGAGFLPEGFTGPEVSLVGFAYTQFALPVRAAAGGRFEFRPAHNLTSPPAVLPLLLTSADGRVELLAPLDAWHEQLIAVEQNETITRFVWGCHGDLDTIPAGFVATLGIFTGGSTAEVFERWGAAVRAGADPRDRRSDPLLTHLSYWTDNGAAYWYRTEPGRSITETLTDKVAELDALGVPVRTVELDSWFYPHETSRSVTETGYLEVVPPTGMLAWTPRPDVLPDGVADLRHALGVSPAGDRPLALHSRHISALSPYLGDGEWWIDTLAAHPVDQAFFERWCADAAAWGATCIEQDWMMVVFFGVRALRSHPGRAMAWQRSLDDAAARHDLSLLWCMALPGDYAAATRLLGVAAVRTSDDYRFAEDPALLWVWYLSVNVLADALGLPVFKDCFFSGPAGVDPTDGDAHAELEAALAALGGGVVGIGDRLGRSDAEVIRRVCRPDGRLVGPDRPIRLADVSMADAGRSGGLCWAQTEITNRLGTWRYVLALNTSDELETRSDTFELDDERLAYQWRTGDAEIAGRLTVTLEPRDWALFVCCPLPEDGPVLVGDPCVYATMGPTRVDVSGEEPRAVVADGEPPPDLLWWTVSA